MRCEKIFRVKSNVDEERIKRVLTVLEFERQPLIDNNTLKPFIHRLIPYVLALMDIIFYAKDTVVWAPSLLLKCGCTKTNFTQLIKKVVIHKFLLFVLFPIFQEQLKDHYSSFMSI